MTGRPHLASSVIIGYETFHKYVEGCRYSKPYSWFSVGRLNETTTNISHLLFADDTIIFCDDVCEQIVNLRGILVWFEAVSGLRVNLSKSFILPIGQVDNIQLLVGVLGCSTDSLPSSYLGLPLGAKFKDEFIYEPVVDRFERRLSRWKSKYLSKGERLTLIKSVLSRIPTCFLSLFPLPVSVAKKLETI